VTEKKINLDSLMVMIDICECSKAIVCELEEKKSWKLVKKDVFMSESWGLRRQWDV